MLVFVVLQFGHLPGGLAQQTGSDFDHASTGFVLNAQHQNVRCETCHTNGVFKGTPKDCASCHGWNNPRAQFSVMPVNHIPTANMSCEMCHQANTAQFIDANRTFSHAMLGGQSCLSCHSSDNPHPNVTVNPADATHAAVLARGQSCDQCHNTTQFTAPKMPVNHIPTAPVACENCHRSSDYRAMPSITDIHANAQSTSSNCQQCHSAGAVVAYAMPGMVPALVGPPDNHIGTSGQSCETCHVGPNSSITATPVRDGANFGNSAFNHSGNTASCASCHGPGITDTTFYRVSPKTVSSLTPAHIPYSGTCDSCHVNSVPVGQIPLTYASGSMTSFANAKFSHAGITSSCGTCHGDGVTASSFYGVVPRNTAQLSPAHIPAAAACETCHVNSIPSTLVSITGAGSNTSFSGAGFSHSGISNGCVNCHGANLGSSSFYGITSLVVMPSTALGGHIPSSTTCESCHLGSVPSSLVSVTAAHPVPGSAFRNAPPSATQIHAASSVACTTCHEAGFNWIGMDLPLYARVPSSYTGLPTTLYKGFQTRPVQGGTSTSVDDAAHPTIIECSNCHGNTVAFGGPAAPSNHIPYASGVSCSTCHGDFSAPPKIGVIHANIQSTNSNCVQCHSTASAALYASATTLNPIKAPGSKHIPMGSLSCEGCHVGANSSMATTPVQDGANFAGSLFNHAGTTVSCATCHGASITATTFTGVYPVGQSVLSPAHLPTTAACESCHTAGAPTGLVPAAGMTTFANARFTHAGITTGCVACHGPSITNSSFYGINPIIVMPSTTDPQGHIPSSTTCENCHLGSVPSGLIAAGSSASVGSSLFRNAPPSSTQIHSNGTGGCSSCHEAGKAWVGMDLPLYARNPAVFTGVNTLYKGFQTRPLAAPSGYSVADPGHASPGDLSTGECSKCHGNTVAFGVPSAPANHIPYISSAVCGDCHAPFGAQPTNAAIHAKLQSPNSNCEQCHSTANAALYASTTTVKPIKTPTANHIPMGNLGCASCHVGANSSLVLPVSNTSSFANSAFSHSGITTGCNDCHGVNVEVGTFDGVTPKGVSGLTPAHIPVANALGCETCHVGSIPPGLVPSTGYAGSPSFAGGQFIHTGITTGCVTCHGSGITSGSFKGVSSIVVMPSTANGGHIPSSTTCENCHLGSVPSGLLSVTASHAMPGSLFKNSPPDTNKIHAGISGGCVNCHEAGLNWIGMTAYPPVPSAKSANANQLYTGFHTRPVAGGVLPSINDASHPDATSGDCSLCHGNVQAFGAVAKPANHIPYATTAQCSACHNPFGQHPTITAIHANLQSASTNCAQCHSAANAAMYSSASRTIVGPASNHVPMRGLGCESCHVGSGSSIATTPVAGAAVFSGSAFSHSGMNTNCAECHGASVQPGTFQGINSIVVMPPTATANSSNHIPSSTTCENCHSGAMPSSLVPGNAPHAAPNSGFLNAPPNTTMTHSGITGGCASCHDTGMVWMGMGAYNSLKVAPYTGFQSRPQAGSGTYFVTDAAHPAGECSNCHSGITAWSVSVKPANHIPSANVACTNCHTTGNYTDMPQRARIHANAQSTSANCVQCHSAANALLYKTATMTIKAPDTNHIGMAALSCESCHVGTGSSIASTPVPETAVFSGSAFNHSGATARCDSCHSNITSSTFQGGIVPVTLQSPVLSPAHVPNPANLDCGACHTAIPTGLSKIGSTNATFAASKFSHAGITTGCNACHGTGISGSSFKGITSIVVLPPTTSGSTSHIPSPVNSQCEVCHLGATPSTPIAANATVTTPGSTKFKTPAPNTAMIHTNITVGCNACHENGNTWVDVSTVYPPTPASLTAGATYTGFQTRPVAGGVSPSIADPSHPAKGVGDCSDCHGSTASFTATAKPSNHIPVSPTSQCQNCHTKLQLVGGSYVSSSVDFTPYPSLPAMVANIHTYAPSTTANCAQCHSAANAATYAIPSVGFTIKSPASIANHIPYGSTGCEVCHVYSGGPLTTPVGNSSTFAGGKFSHSGFTTGCATCHGAGVTNTTFTGVTAIVAIPASTTVNGTTTHIPYSASCETCHSASVPSALVSVTATGTKFAMPPAAGTVIHSNSTGFACKACHERGYVWLGMGNYPRTPAAVNTTAPTTAYNGFQTRPGSTPTTYGYIDAGHTGTTLDTGDCSQCHAGTTSFTGEGKPAGHMPTGANTCGTCHLSTTGDYSVVGLGSLTALHTGITYGALVPATTANMLTKTCGTCHTVGTGGTSGTAPFAGCQTETPASACPTPPPITYQPTTTGLHPVHVPIGTTAALTVDCNGCHTSVSSYAGVNMKNASMHTSVNGVAKVMCMSCHERGLAFYGVTNLRVRPNGHHTGQDCAGSGCHTYSGGFRAQVKPVMRGALVSPDMGRIRPTIQTNKPSRGSLGNTFDHKGVEAGKCKTCHDGKAASGMPARHLMVATSCDTCHRTTAWLPAEFNHNGITPNTCLVCHNGMGASGKPSGHFMTSRSCDSCHKSTAWTPVNYQHVSPLYKASPDKLSCVSCHDTNGEIIRRQARALSRTKPIAVGP
jgi:hypothetical protein